MNDGNESAPKRPWLLWVGIAIGALVLLACCLGVGGLVCAGAAVQDLASGTQSAAADAEVFRGQPIDACWQESFTRGWACGDGAELGCRMRSQFLLTRCMEIATISPDYCADKDQEFCARECTTRGAMGSPDEFRCGVVCSQLFTVIDQHCRAQ